MIFAAVTFLMLFAFGYTPSRYHKQAKCAEVSQADVFDAGVLAATDQGSKETNQKAEQEYQDKRDFATACSDLAAQWSVADITRRAFWVGMVGLGALLMTLMYTRAASDAANKTLDVAKRATEAEFQPYFRFPDKVNIQIVNGRNTDGTSRITIMFRDFEFENIGKTPAKNAYFEIRSRVKDAVGGESSAEIDGLKRGDFAPTEKWKFRLYWHYDFLDGRGLNLTVRNMEFYLIFTFNDMFTNESRRKYIVKYVAESQSLGAYLISTEEVADE